MLSHVCSCYSTSIIVLSIFNYSESLWTPKAELGIFLANRKSECNPWWTSEGHFNGHSKSGATPHFPAQGLRHGEHSNPSCLQLHKEAPKESIKISWVHLNHLQVLFDDSSGKQDSVSLFVASRTRVLAVPRPPRKSFQLGGSDR